MPIVPVTGGPQVGPGQTPTPRAPLEDFGGGQAARTIDLSGLADTAFKIHQEAKAKADQIAVVDAGSKISALETSLLYDPQKGVLNQRGKNAIDAADQAAQAWQKQSSEIENSLTNDDQKIQFRRMAEAHWSSINEQSQRHVANEAKTYDNESTAAYLSNEANAGISAALADPKRVEASIGNQSAAIRDFGARNGWPAEQIAEHVAASVSKTRLGVVERMLNADQDQTAANYFQQHRADFVGADLMQGERLAAAGSTRAGSRSAADMITLGSKSPSLITPGNIDLTNRPRVANPDGSVSTVRSMSFEEDGKEILIPTVSEDGEILTNDEAIAQYKKTGQHLGIFSDPISANLYAERLHEAQADMIAGNGDGVPRAATSLTDAMRQVDNIQDPKIADAAERRVRQYYADQASDRRQQSAEAYQRAHDVLEQTGDLDKIPRSDWLQLTESDARYLTFREREIHDRSVKTDPDILNTLKNAAGLHPDKFMSVDLTQYKDKLSPKDFTFLQNKQLSMRVGQATHDTRTAEAEDRRKEHQAESDARAAARKVQAAADKAAAEAKKKAAALKTLQDLGIHIGPAVPGAPLTHTPPPNAPGTKPTTGKPGGLDLKPAPSDSIASLPIPDTWKSYANDDQDYAAYLEHHGEAA